MHYDLHDVEHDHGLDTEQRLWRASAWQRNAHGSGAERAVHGHITPLSRRRARGRESNAVGRWGLQDGRTTNSHAALGDRPGLSGAQTSRGKSDEKYGRQELNLKPPDP